MIVDIDKCSACGTGHKQQEILRDGSGQHYFLCEQRVSAAHPGGVPVYVTIDRPPAEAELEDHRQRLQALMKGAIAPLLARIDAAEAKAAEAEEASCEIARRLQEERDRKDEARLVEARARFRAALIVEHLNGDDPMACGEYSPAEQRPLTRLEEASRAVAAVLGEVGLSW